MVPINPKLTIDVEAEHCCNWKCCLWPLRVPIEPSAPAPSPIILEGRAISDITNGSDISEKIEVVFHRHHHKKQKITG